jgi:hydroxymethylpyrimidine kinase/phosphomethylpyrimidine kinase
VNILLVSGLDPSGGAGLLADARVVERHGLRPVGVATALTEQTTAGVRAANPVSAELVGAQLTALLSDLEVAAVKIGMLGSAAIAAEVARALALTRAPVVWDPVLRPTAGNVPLYDGDPAAALALLADHLAVVTPNLAEAALLTGRPVDDVTTVRRAAAELAARVGAALVKGGHLVGPPVDVLASGGRIVELAGARIAGGEVHGTGCALSTALACGLARGEALEDAAARAVGFVRDRLAAPVAAGRGLPSVL